MSKLQESDSDQLSYELVSLEEVLAEALLEHYDSDAANNAFNRLNICHIAGFAHLTHQDRLAICKGIFKYHTYLVFELRTPAPEVLHKDASQLLIACDNWLTLRITFKEEQEVDDSDKEFDYEQLALHSRYILKFSMLHFRDYKLHLREDIWQ